MAPITASCRSCNAAYDATSGPLRCPGCEALVPPHPSTSAFARLGLPVSVDLDDAAVESAWLKRSRLVHPDRFASKPPAERRTAAEQTVALNDAYRALKTPFDRGAWLVRSTGTSEPRQPQAALMAFMEAREEAEASPEGRAAVVADTTARFARGLARLTALLAAVDWAHPDAPAHQPTLASAAGVLAELRTLGRLSADLGGPVLIGAQDGR